MKLIFVAFVAFVHISANRMLNVFLLQAWLPVTSWLSPGPGTLSWWPGTKRFWVDRKGALTLGFLMKSVLISLPIGTRSSSSSSSGSFFFLMYLCTSFRWLFETYYPCVEGWFLDCEIWILFALHPHRLLDGEVGNVVRSRRWFRFQRHLEGVSLRCRTERALDQWRRSMDAR